MAATSALGQCDSMHGTYARLGKWGTACDCGHLGAARSHRRDGLQPLRGHTRNGSRRYDATCPPHVWHMRQARQVVVLAVTLVQRASTDACNYNHDAATGAVGRGGTMHAYSRTCGIIFLPFHELRRFVSTIRRILCAAFAMATLYSVLHRHSQATRDEILQHLYPDECIALAGANRWLYYHPDIVATKIAAYSAVVERLVHLINRLRSLPRMQNH